MSAKLVHCHTPFFHVLATNTELLRQPEVSRSSAPIHHVSDRSPLTQTARPPATAYLRLAISIIIALLVCKNKHVQTRYSCTSRGFSILPFRLTILPSGPFLTSYLRPVQEHPKQSHTTAVTHYRLQSRAFYIVTKTLHVPCH